MSKNNSNHALLIEISFIILTVGLILEVSLEGEEAKLRVFGNYVKANVGSFITQAELQQNQQALANTHLSFNIEKITKNVDGKKSFANVVNQCFFVSDEDIGTSCVKCVLKDDADPPNIIGSGEITLTGGIDADMEVTIPISPVGSDPFSHDVQNFHKVKVELCLPGLLILDEDAIDNDVAPNFFTSVQINDNNAAIGNRGQLPFFAANVGLQIPLRTGDVGDEGWFVPETTLSSWDAAGPTDNGLVNYFQAGPGLGTADANGDREALLDNIPDLNPLRADGLAQLVGEDVCAVVYNSSISIGFDPLEGNLKGDNLGIVAFHVDSLTVRAGTPGFGDGTLPEATITILDANQTCDIFVQGTFPVLESSSEPFDVIPGP